MNILRTSRTDYLSIFAGHILIIILDLHSCDEFLLYKSNSRFKNYEQNAVYHIIYTQFNIYKGRESMASKEKIVK